MQYTQALWLLIFFLYCFLGWVWESLYVSVRKREWVNRGFLHGPLLPIYGFGAIIILWLTLPFRDSLPLIFVLGMFGATILEYVTGAVMERLFHMRYWDYSNQPFNLHGHISLFTSLGWGLFSLLLVKILHPPIEALLLTVPSSATEPISLLFMIGFVVDTTRSVQTALDMKELITKLTESNESFALLETKLAAAAASISQGSDEFKKHVQAIEASMQEKITLIHQHKQIRKQSRQAFLLEKLQEHRDRKSRLLALLHEKADATIQEVLAQMQATPPENKQARLSGLLRDLYEFKDGLRQAELNLAARKDKEYKRAANLIRRNPSSVSRRFKEAFGEIKLLNGTRRRHHEDEGAK